MINTSKWAMKLLRIQLSPGLCSIRTAPFFNFLHLGCQGTSLCPPSWGHLLVCHNSKPETM